MTATAVNANSGIAISRLTVACAHSLAVRRVNGSRSARRRPRLNEPRGLGGLGGLGGAGAITPGAVVSRGAITPRPALSPGRWVKAILR